MKQKTKARAKRKKQAAAVPAKPMRPQQLTVERIEFELDLPVKHWPGNCYSIACGILRAKLIEGIAVYGHYYGPIADGGYFQPRKFTQHGWIVTPDYTLVDPTRWVFEDVDPYIFVADSAARKRASKTKRLDVNTLNDEYDISGDAIRQLMRGPCPPFDRTRVLKKKYSFELKDKAALKFVMGELGDPPLWTHEQLHWIATMSLSKLGVHAKPIYEALVEGNLAVYIPIDYRYLVLGGGVSYARES